MLSGTPGPGPGSCTASAAAANAQIARAARISSSATGISFSNSRAEIASRATSRYLRSMGGSVGQPGTPPAGEIENPQNGSRWEGPPYPTLAGIGADHYQAAALCLGLCFRSQPPYSRQWEHSPESAQALVPKEAGPAFLGGFGGVTKIGKVWGASGCERRGCGGDVLPVGTGLNLSDEIRLRPGTTTGLASTIFGVSARGDSQIRRRCGLENRLVLIVRAEGPGYYGQVMLLNGAAQCGQLLHQFPFRAVRPVAGAMRGNFAPDRVPSGGSRLFGIRSRTLKIASWRGRGW